MVLRSASCLSARSTPSCGRPGGVSSRLGRRSSAKGRPRSAAPAPPRARGRTPASRSCGHRCCGLRVVGTGRCQIHALVFFLVTHDPAPRLGANMGGGRLTDRIDGMRRGSAVSRRVACATMAVPRDRQGAALGEPDVGLNLSSETRMTIDSPRIISRDEARALGLSATSPASHVSMVMSQSIT